MELNAQALRSLEADVGAELLPMILQRFEQELAQRREQVAGALEAADLARLQGEAHSLVSTARTVGLDALADLAREIEGAAKAGDADAALAAAPALVALCEKGCELVAARRG